MSSFWRSPLLILATLFCALMFAAIAPAVAPSSANWTGGIVCPDGSHLASQSADTSYGTTSSVTITYGCVDAAGHGTEVSTMKIFGLQFLLAAVIGYVVLFVGLGLWTFRPRRVTTLQRS